MKVRETSFTFVLLKIKSFVFAHSSASNNDNEKYVQNC